jgi:hypothetical protein
MSSAFTDKLTSRIANFFNRPLEAAFGKTGDGRDVVYLWPWKHPGYVLPNDASTRQLRATMGWWIRMALPIFVIFAALGVHALISFGALYMAGYYMTVLGHLNRLALDSKPAVELPAQE